MFFTSATLSGLAAVATIIITSIIWGIFIIGLAPLAGSMIANVTRRFVKNHRSPALNYTLVAGMIVGTISCFADVSGPPALFVMLSGGTDVMSGISFFLARALADRLSCHRHTAGIFPLLRSGL
ncbi:MAG: hypothetical protein IPO36_18645 [Anaerolineales bacterium]|nr:hypothetical protein [Anaerolineales bacterium]